LVTGTIVGFARLSAFGFQRSALNLQPVPLIAEG
jgi:hypothetical protein